MARHPIPPEKELDWRFFKASGPGGQHRNKTETGVRLTHLPTGTVVTATERRSRHQNMQAALLRLAERLSELNRPVKIRRPTKPSRAARKKRLEAKKHRAKVKARRGRMGPEEY